MAIIVAHREVSRVTLEHGQRTPMFEKGTMGVARV